MLGKKIRMERIINRETKKMVIIPMDHGTTMGPIKGLTDMKHTVNMVVNGGANAIILHKGIVEAGYRGGGKDIGLIVHLSCSTSLSPDPNAKIQVCTIEEAIQLGADAVSIHINLGAETESSMLYDLAMVVMECRNWGIPLLAMMYTRGKKITNEFDVKYVKHAARVAAELGVDIVKVNYTGSIETFREVVEGTPIPVVIAGGEKTETDMDLFEMVDGAMKAGAMGVSIGRNAFQHESPQTIVRAISAMVHNNASIIEAEAIMKGEK